MHNGQSDIAEDCWKIVEVWPSWEPMQEASLSGEKFLVSHYSDVTSAQDQFFSFQYNQEIALQCAQHTL